jgi:SAM-dependent methyltransferase
LLLHLLRIFQDARSAVEIGCGTGHFAGFLAEQRLNMIGLDRAPAMLLKARRRFPSLSVILGDAHRLPFRDRSADLAIFVTALEFLEDPINALREAVRVARKGIITLVLNRYSLGGLSRRWGPQSRGALLGQASDYSVRELRYALQKAASSWTDAIVAISTLLPDGLSGSISSIPLGDVIGCAVTLKP